ncbi:MAG: 50S ribosomal protein L25/general stress protein Ctc [Bacteroidales bacterium]|jgi:large subunit ribosomal protein L25|nr:50S ribosomal protein L25/general stress protein Ctc [Bacteroidales bacterium]MDD4830092.1 50S ribosomal protein L25/general stress protein Ctc [Bacteroidales bacterium]
MKTVSMSGSLRQNVGKKDAKELRRQSRVPCVVYGGEEQVRFSVLETEFKSLLFTPETNFVDLNIDGTITKAVLQEIQYHPVTDQVVHADFLRLFDDKPITISVPVKTVGVAPGVLQGGKLTTKIRKMKLKGLPNDLPQYVEVDISKLDLGQGVKVEDIDIPNIEKLDVKSSVLIWIKPTRQAK